LLEEQDKTLHPTLAGYLFFANRQPQHLFELSRHFVQCVKYAGTSPGSPIVDKKEVDGTLDEQVDKTHRFILDNIHLHAAIVGVKRVETYEYPIDALREVVINALTIVITPMLNISERLSFFKSY